MFIILNVQAK